MNPDGGAARPQPRLDADEGVIDHHDLRRKRDVLPGAPPPRWLQPSSRQGLAAVCIWLARYFLLLKYHSILSRRSEGS